jgi:nitroreductase
MPDLMEIIKKRRSIRKYADKDVPQEILSEIFEAVRWAPSWANTQCWDIVAVTDPDQKIRLQDTLPPKGNPARTAIVQAPVLLAVCGRLKESGYYKELETTKFGDWFMFDLGLATQNLCLAACNRGLGTVVVGLFDHDKAKEVLKVPEGQEVLVLIPLGYPAKQSSPPKRKELAEFVHTNAF